MAIDITDAINEARERVESNRKAIRESLNSNPPPPGLTPIGDEEFMAFVEAMIQQSPPEPMLTPDGQVVIESPWIVMLSLSNVDGGKPILDRMLRIQRKMEGANALL